jgi:ribitol 2-dehydrogenase
LATSEVLMRAGAIVVMVDRNEAVLNELVAKSGGKAIAQVTDLLDAKSCAAMIPEVLAGPAGSTSSTATPAPTSAATW